VLDGQCYECHQSHGGKMEKLLPTAADDPQLCSKCHAELMKTEGERSIHPFFKAGKCLRCHNVHASNVAGMLESKQGFLCYSCHGTDPGKEIKEPASKHAPVVEGRCSQCHNPHKAKLVRLLLADYPDLCLACHSDLKNKMFPEKAAASAQVNAPVASVAAGQGSAPAAGAAQEAPAEKARIYLHAPSDLKNCNLCHQPHFAEEPALASKPIQQLCADCHDYQKDPFKVAHINISADQMNCSKCHDSHASTDPKLFRAQIHKPFAERKCKDCHIVE